MTTINTVDDLIRALDENPEWVEALRARLLTPELLAMPQTLAQLAVTMRQQFDAVNTNAANFRQEVNNTFAELRQEMKDGFQVQREYTDAKVGELRQEMKDGFQAQRDYTDAKVGELRQEMKDGFQAQRDCTDAKVGELRQEMHNGFQAIRSDIGVLKAGHALTTVLKAPSAITDGLGLTRVRILDYDALRDLTLTGNVADIPHNVILSFRRADLVMEAVDSSGETCYVAVEVSFTANGRDTERAIRNAAFLTRFTGRPAYAAVAGVNQDHRIEERIAAGEVFWHQLELYELESE